MSVRDKINAMNRPKEIAEELKARDCPEVWAKKSACIYVRPIEPGTKVVTYTDRGEETNEVEAKEGQMLAVAARPDGSIIYVQGDKENSWLIDKDVLEKKYDVAKMREDGFVEPKGGIQHFIQTDRDVELELSWGHQTIPAGGYLNITNKNDIYGVEQKLFEETYQTVEAPEKAMKAPEKDNMDR